MNEMEIRSLTLVQLEKLMLQLGEKSFHAVQVYEWVHKKLADSFDEMTNLSKELREKLKECANFAPVVLKEKLVSQDEGVIKYLFEIENNLIIESVFMKFNYGNTVCISTQAGCRMGCGFCASGVSGLERNLMAGEMAAQVYNIQRDVGERISNIVVMGIGEPFDNYDQVMKFIRMVNDKHGLEIGQRSITISTCGLVNAINKFADEDTQVNLAVSLHAPNDEIRKQIMPVAKRYGMAQLLEACRAYCDKTNRRITYEYALISGFNDSAEHAKELGEKLKNTLCHVNLITINDITAQNSPPSSRKRIEEFAEALKEFGIETTIRRSRGADIDAACGQLRSRYLE